MKRSAIAATAALMVVLLAGCSAPTTPDTASPSDQASPAPLVASTPAAEEPGADEAEQVFLTEVRSRLTQTSDASDEQLIAAGHDACDQWAAGVAPEDQRHIEGEQPSGSGRYRESLAITLWAAETFCPQFSKD